MSSVVTLLVGNTCDTFSLEKLNELQYFQNLLRFNQNETNEPIALFETNEPITMDDVKAVIESVGTQSVIKEVKQSVATQSILNFLFVADYFTIDVTDEALQDFINQTPSGNYHQLQLVAQQSDTWNNIKCIQKFKQYASQHLQIIHQSILVALTNSICNCIEINSIDVKISNENEFNVLSSNFIRKYNCQEDTRLHSIQKLKRKIRTVAQHPNGISVATRTLKNIFQLLRLFNQKRCCAKFVNINLVAIDNNCFVKFTEWIEEAMNNGDDVMQEMVMPALDFLKQMESQWLKSLIINIPFNDALFTTLVADPNWTEFICDLY